MLAALAIVLLAGLLVAGTFFWLGQRGAEVTGPPELIEAEPGPYKVKPTDPGGLDVAGESETAFQTSAGEDKDAQLDLSAVPEQPVAAPKPEPKPEAPANPAGAAGGADRRVGQRDPARLLRQSGAGRARLVGAVGAFPEHRGDEQDHHALLQRHPAARRRGLAGRRQGGVPEAQGGRRKLLRGELMQAAIYGLAGTELSDDERSFFRDADAAGYILFKRNCATPEQVLRLTDALRDLQRARRPCGA